MNSRANPVNNDQRPAENSQPVAAASTPNPGVNIPIWFIGIIAPIFVAIILGGGSQLLSLRDASIIATRRLDVLESDVNSIKKLTDDIRLLSYKLDSTMLSIVEIKNDINTMKVSPALFTTNLHRKEK